ncbi:hypothetical protein [Geodermatophilus marinus]|uniref:hypothetical protein n=1 Tax=Geodermatophilus sp. LHW52908 TaxID=2303986 RepID=UPI000E3E9C7E|nr:hypothetical protein [Geodermatophilus sp. LHW52908]RFU19081.1 hypothetical protein D0Z06_23380 [Geodermatophilus sp. LHW52908]
MDPAQPLVGTTAGHGDRAGLRVGAAVPAHDGSRDTAAGVTAGLRARLPEGATGTILGRAVEIPPEVAR